MPVKAVDFEPTTSTDSVTLAAGDLSYQQIAVRKSLLRGFTALSARENGLSTRKSTLTAHARGAVGGNIGACLGVKAGILRAAIPH